MTGSQNYNEQYLDTAKIAIIFILMKHAIFMLFFFLMGQDKLVIAHIFSTTTYMILLSLIDKNILSFTGLASILQFEIPFYSSVCISILGWGWGFELILYSSVLSTFFSSNAFKKFNFVMVGAQGIIFLALYFIIGEKPINQELVWWKDLFFILNLITISLISIVLSYTLELSNSFAYLNILHQKESIKNLASHDPLTGLLNRTSMNQIINDFDKTTSNGFAVMICDIDNFKKINDKYGHDIGDVVLKNAANIFKGIFREGKYICRWGGEEFLVFIDNVNSEDSYKIISRIKDAINTNVIKQGKITLKFTMTFGLTNTQKGEILDVNKMIQKADDLLYYGKHNGKNRIIRDKPETNEETPKTQNKNKEILNLLTGGNKTE